MTWPLIATKRLTHDDYTVAWICALPHEKTAARNMLDELHYNPPQPEHDKNIYTFGSIYGHNVVIVCQGDMGTSAAATIATRMDGAFKRLRFGLLVGIAGGVPDKKDIRLGDVVISKGDGLSGGVVAHDRGKVTEMGFESRPFLNGVPEVLRNAFSELASLFMDQDSKIPAYISAATTRNPRFRQFNRPALVDNLFKSSYPHVDPKDDKCKKCEKDEKHLEARKPRDGPQDVPFIHFGTIASGNQVIKNSTERARIAAAHPGVLAVEMEAAGLMNIFGCATIRGICDYADSHKNDDWQNYAAATASACAKEVLRIIPVVKLDAMPAIPIATPLDSLAGLLKDILDLLVRQFGEAPSPSVTNPTILAWMRADAYLLLEYGDFEANPAELFAALKALESLFRNRSRLESTTCDESSLYRNLRDLQRRSRQSRNDGHADLVQHVQRKRKHEQDDVIEKLSLLDKASKKCRHDSSQDWDMTSEMDIDEADFATLTRKHSLSLHRGLRAHWSCNCESCHGLSVRLALPQPARDPSADACFDVFFSMQLSSTELMWQEGKISVTDNGCRKVQFETQDSPIEPDSKPDFKPDSKPEYANICQSIRDSLNHRICLHLLFENGRFKRLPPDRKTFDETRTPPGVSLATLFERPKQLHRDILTFRGKRTLAVILATALMPFLETPWLQPSFAHSQVHFFQPLHDGELPSITKPFLAIKQAPLAPTTKAVLANTGNNIFEHTYSVHPHPTVLALGILLCELHYCLPIDTWRSDKDLTNGERNVNTDYYTARRVLNIMKSDVHETYYLAVKACLEWEYLPLGRRANFESTTVQQKFYQLVVKRLKAEARILWTNYMGNLNALTREDNEACWGPQGRVVVRQQEI